MKQLFVIKNLFLMLFAVLAVMACSSDDKDEPVATPAAAVVGTYSGYTAFGAKMIPAPMTEDDEKLTIAADEAGKSNNIVFETKKFGKYVVNNITTKLEGNNYVLTGEGVSLIGMPGKEPKEYPCTLKGTISKDRTTVEIVFTLPSVMGGTTLTFKTGKAPAATEKPGNAKQVFELFFSEN